MNPVKNLRLDRVGTLFVENRMRIRKSEKEANVQFRIKSVVPDSNILSLKKKKTAFKVTWQTYTAVFMQQFQVTRKTYAAVFM